MTPAIPILLALALGLIGWLAARSRAWVLRKVERAAGGDLHSLPNYHGWYVALWAAIPALVFAVAWNAISPQLILGRVLATPAAQSLPAFGIKRDAILAEAQGLASGATTAGFQSGSAALVEPFRAAMNQFSLIGILVTLILGFAGGAFAYLRLRPNFTARTRVERAVMGGLIAASLVAILTTFGILASLMFETARFFQIVNPVDFLFGTHWGPDPMSDPSSVHGDTYGAVPLFWGTIYIGAIIAMVVAIPLGLMSAIFLTQYAT
ncbi:MAG: phosphate ABC transporter permease family protein, partial [Proteobacteria bacterium]|nr:phosphate ABC transporter permease family protein [Pseudomonadota bacterium]